MMSYTDLPEPVRAQLEAERTAIETHIGNYVRILRGDDFPGDPPVIQEWIAACEWTNIQMEHDDAGGRDVIARDGATLSAGLGLGMYIRDRYGN